MSSITPQSNGLATLVARVFLSILFILAGFSKLTAISGTAGYFAGLGLPVPTVTAVLVGLVEFLGGLAILVGFQTRIAAAIVALFTIGATLVAHMNFAEGMNAMMAQKNLAIAGGLILLALQGAGSISIDAKRG
ncbi:DoxX family protein [Brucella pituitosa]|uniref:DoxX family protein n=1 Tax=Brucella pituitosa TaxID=571256 RepID=A0A643F153_9HYPH|nr:MULTISPECIES: DoxX family protein [Brucella]PQZ48423.1 DoxX family protein [Ochrobactrum sp. MYb19]PRA51631.1 DoxX family protein [Ochrobactrum sp. MYb68]PRA64606.1 DoxX family protein [Ochrobactrum sp. MYb18]PRA74882.1 DoxX family protein [Brucella thiophenivorans]PRA83845.1 DoxX family protein [Ochrobactrum sp. MYb29]PRA89905.1 DoxX family protein [Ochrobactrum sp. MYb14]PRA96938.1 DoxX family protein [Ochrobactrum sp. MYb15]